MLSREENELMCRVGPGTLMGKTLRRYWHPLCLSSELPRPDCAPQRARLLGEKLVVFRDTQGRIGLLDEYCLHRGSSLALGRVEEGGIRCLYHGWKFAVDGALLETPNHADPRLCKALKANAYSVVEEAGIVWAYLGPKDQQPPLRRFPFMAVPAENRTLVRVNVNANYVQMWEGGADSSHVGILHSNVARPGWMKCSFSANPDPLNPAAFPVEDNAPRLEAQDTEFGFYYCASRKGAKPGPNGEETKNVRVYPLIMPYTRVIPAPNLDFTVFEVPADDEHTSTFISVHGNAPVDRAAIIKILGLDDPRYWSEKDCRFQAGWDDRFGQDRERMRENWTGFSGIEVEDAVMGMSQAPINDRTREHLVAADQAIVKIRRLLLDSARRVEKGLDPIGVHADLSKIDAPCDIDIPARSRWQDLVPDFFPPPSRREPATAK
jgi:phthalate 4,5-dioxygenase oxygenase subunit